MIHPDGIEVYLKPAGEENEGLRYAEFPVRNEDGTTFADGDRERHSIILADGKSVTVVVRCAPTFKMQNASALLVIVADGYKCAVDERMTGKFVIQRSFAYEQWSAASSSVRKRTDIEREHTRKIPFSMIAHVQALSGKFDNLAPRPLGFDWNETGSIVVVIQRGTTMWKDLMGGNNKPSHGGPYGPGNPAVSRKRVHGQSRPLDNQYGQCYTFVFRYRSEACIRLAATLSVGAKEASKPLEALAVVDDLSFVRNRELDKVEREKTNTAWLKSEAELKKGGKNGPDQVNQTSDKAEPVPQSCFTVDRTNPARSAKPPPTFCDCPVKHRQQPKRSRVSRGPKSGISTKSPSSNQKLRQATEDGDDDSSSDTGDLPLRKELPEMKADPMQASACSKCKGIKIAQSKRPAYLRQYYDDVSSPAKPSADQDDEEPCDGTKLQTASLDAEETEELSVGTALPGATTDMLSVAAKVDAGEKPTAPSRAIDDFSEKACKITSPALETTQVKTDRQEIPMREGTGGADAAPTDTASAGKRPASADLESAKTKQPRIDVDLTADDDDVAEIKRESISDKTIVTTTIDETGDDEEALQERLNLIKLRQEKLELREEQMGVEAKLKALRRTRARKASLKAEEVIKLED
ncbi:hypothetical protein LTR08_009172 [Meristemomyces frigidus]|nr:hypothetical protein LTR08_009172 [Meristemomyces frigidus]